MAAPPCQHPQSATHFDRVRGQTSCTLCGQVLSDQHFELDPAFNRGGDRGGGAGAMRGGASFARPSRPTTMLGSHGLNRPSMEAARRQLTAIARKLSIPPAQVDVACGVFKSAVTANAVVGARSAVLCACLYVVCRRQQATTPLTVLDFADVTGDSPYSILGYMKTICKLTNTVLPPVEPVFLIVRLVNHLDLGPQAESISIYGMKVMRAMRDDWIATGRRPLGVAAAALLVACQVHGVDISLEQLAKLVRLNQFTVVMRVEEFAMTPTAGLNSIDDYDPATAGQTTAPAAFQRGRKNDTEYENEDSQRDTAALFYELVNEAKERAPATPERCEKWKKIIAAKSRASGVPESELPGDLAALTHDQQLELLGTVSRRLKAEQTEVKPEPVRTQSQEVDIQASIAKARELLGTDEIRDIEATAAAKEGAGEGPSMPASTADGDRPVLISASRRLPPADTRDQQVMELVLSDGEDVEDEYIEFDNEARLRREAANKAAFKDEWDKVGMRVANAITARERRAAAGDFAATRAKRERAPAADSALEAIRRGLAQRGGGNIDLSRLEDILPGVSERAGRRSGAASNAEDNGSQFGGDPAFGPSGAASVADAFADDWLVE
eukprot:CAMPEP_0174834314 /NCGR_PEP_ID=MMETSP1114-20130205/4757_1 /TAXON_ID=312471 /ORGANISM="Neobodo designis, Strain CCAP 1951/1" /LENGTH=612 /DNA_ID=CAMNT_0016068221 /DNA_START=35 /DNA_END=1873 /DNA_ORIENTATION=+